MPPPQAPDRPQAPAQGGDPASEAALAAEDSSRSSSTRALLVLWPAFVMAGVLEMLVFAMVDPESLHGFGAGPLGWSRIAIYSVTFLVFWAVIAVSAGVTQLLQAPGPAREFP